MLATNSPFRQYFDLDGSPLTGGSLYFGAANQNPETSPVTVYWDAAGTQPASQPIPTLNGYPVRSSNPANVYVSADYSITARNSRGQLVFHAANSADFDVMSSASSLVSALTTRLSNTTPATDGGGMVGHSASQSYGTATSGKAINARGISITDHPYNADPTGVASAVSAITAAIAALTDGGELIAIGEFLLDSTVTIDKPITLRGSGTSNLNNVASGTVFKKAAAMTTEAFLVTANGAKLSNFIVQGIAGNTGNGVNVQANRVTLEDLCTYGCGGDGVRIGTDAGVNANLWNIRNLRSKSNTGHGLHISDKVSPTGADANGGTLVHADLQSNGDAGCRLGNAQLNTFVGLVCQSNTGRGLSLGAGADHNTFVGGDFESNTADEIGIEAGASANKFFGGTVTGTLTDNGSGTQFAFLGGTVYEAGVKVANVGSSDSKTFDWYEEGSWTPAITFSTAGDLAVTYTTQLGRFQRVGNRVVASFTVVTATFTHTTASGGLRVTGLPYTSQGTASIYGTGEVQYSGITAAANQDISARVDPSTTYIGFFGSGSGVANINIATGNVPTGGSVVLVGTVSYQV